MLKILIIFAVTIVLSLLICFLFFALTKKDTKKISDNLFFGLIYPVVYPVVIIFVFSCWLFHENKKQFNQEPPKIIQTISQPQVDTTITIIENVRDTSYTYYFFNYFVD